LLEFGAEDLGAVLSVAPPIASASERLSALDTIIDHWLQKDPNALRRFIREEAKGGLKNEITWKLTIRLASLNRLDEATHLLEEMPFSARRSQAINDVASCFIGRDVSGAITWLNALDLP